MFCQSDIMQRTNQQRRHIVIVYSTFQAQYISAYL